jgi:flagellar basal body-associated protein FliL
MFVSRSESHQHNKKRKSRRMKRLLVINLIMLGIICGLVIFYFMMGGTGGTKNQANGTGQHDADKPSEDTASDPQAVTDA